MLVAIEQKTTRVGCEATCVRVAIEQKSHVLVAIRERTPGEDIKSAIERNEAYDVTSCCVCVRGHGRLAEQTTRNQGTPDIRSVLRAQLKITRSAHNC